MCFYLLLPRIGHNVGVDFELESFCTTFHGEFPKQGDIQFGLYLLNSQSKIKYIFSVLHNKCTSIQGVLTIINYFVKNYILTINVLSSLFMAVLLCITKQFYFFYILYKFLICTCKIANQQNSAFSVCCSADTI